MMHGNDGPLDAFLPHPDVRERHETVLPAPPGIVYDTACATDLGAIPAVRGIIRLRELILGAKGSGRRKPQGVVEETLALGWGRLAERRGRILVMGAVTRPWEANVVFRALPPDRFAGFSEPNYVKIAWTIEAEPVDDDHTLFRTETRAQATDPEASRRFRRYWRLFKIGILLIRWMMLMSVRRETARRTGTGTA